MNENTIWNYIDKKRIKLCILASFILGCFAHAFRYFSTQFSSDSINRIYIDEGIVESKLVQGRYLGHVYMYLRHWYSVPWLIGIVSLLVISFSAYLLTNIFEIEKDIQIILIAGLMAVNHSLTLINASCIYVSDVYMWTVLMYVLAAYILIKCSRWYYAVLAGFVITLGLAAYQAYVPLVPVIIMLWIIIKAFDNANIKMLVNKLLMMFLALFAAGIFYVTGVVIVVKSNGYEYSHRFSMALSSSENFIIEKIKNIVGAYIYIIKFYFQRTYYNNNLMRSLNAVFVVLIIIGVIALLKKMKPSIGNKLVIIAFGVLVPLAMCSLYVLLNGQVMHHYMTYHFLLLYVCAIVVLNLIEKNEAFKKKYIGYVKRIVYVGVSLVIYLSILFANDIYLKKNLEYDDTLLIFNRIISRIEMLEGYHVDKENEVVFIGNISESVYGQKRYEFEQLYDDYSMSSSFATTTYSKYKGVMDYLLNYPITVVDDEVAEEYSTKPEVIEMPCFPENGSVKYVDGKIVVKIVD